MAFACGQMPCVYFKTEITFEQDFSSEFLQRVIYDGFYRDLIYFAWIRMAPKFEQRDGNHHG